MVACNDPPGLTLEVVPLDASISRVEVYLGDHCDTCPDAMAPPMMRPRAANIYETNYSQVFAADSSDATNWHDGHAFFRITSPDAHDSQVSYLLAIGFDKNGVPIALNRYHDVAIPAAATSYWQVPLDEPLKPLTDAPSPDERIAIWPMARPAGPRCVLIENGGGGQADAVVPHDDPDCDGVTPAMDCAPFTPNAVAVAPTLAETRCVANATGVLDGGGTTPPQICLLGGPACTDGQTSQGCEYLDVDYCAPMALCNACAGQDWDTCPKVKILAAETTTGIPYVGCNIAMQIDGTQCPDASKRSADIVATDFVAQGGGTKCLSMTISEPTLPLAFKTKLVIGGATLELTNFKDDCSATLEWSGNYMRTLGAAHGLLIDLALDNGKHMVVPFALHFADSCINGTACTRNIPSTTESMLQCASSTQDAATTCTAQTECTNGGIACGGRCCGKGENCTGGVCRCGAGPHCVGDTHFCVTSSANPGITGCGDVCCGLPGTPACPP